MTCTSNWTTIEDNESWGLDQFQFKLKNKNKEQTDIIKLVF